MCNFVRASQFLLRYFLIVVLLTHSASADIYYTTISSACTLRETLGLGAEIPDPIRSQIKGAPTDLNSGIQAYLMSARLRSTTGVQVGADLSDYLRARAFYAMGLFHPAQKGFYSILTGPVTPSNVSFKLAALACLNELHESGFYTPLSEEFLSYLNVLSSSVHTKGEREIIWQAATAIAGENASNNLTFKSELLGQIEDLVGKSGSYLDLVQTLDFTSRSKEEYAVCPLMNLLERGVKLPPALSKQSDILHYLFGLIYYNKSEYGKAIYQFGHVGEASKYFSHSAVATAWAYLLNEEYNKAIASVFPYVQGQYSSDFEPDAPLILAVSYFETCNYPQALQSLKFFKRNYYKIYSYLYDWYKHREHPQINYYEYLNQARRTPGYLPQPIISAWLRHPMVSLLLNQLTLIEDERVLFQTIMGQISKGVSTEGTAGDSLTQKAKLSLQNDLKNSINEIPGIKLDIQNKINLTLLNISNDMAKSLGVSIDNGQLIDATVLGGVGDTLLNKAKLADLVKRSQDSSGVRRLASVSEVDIENYLSKNKAAPDLNGANSEQLPVQVTQLCGENKKQSNLIELPKPQGSLPSGRLTCTVPKTDAIPTSTPVPTPVAVPTTAPSATPTATPAPSPRVVTRYYRALATMTMTFPDKKAESESASFILKHKPVALSCDCARTELKSHNSKFLGTEQDLSEFSKATECLALIMKSGCYDLLALRRATEVLASSRLFYRLSKDGKVQRNWNFGNGFHRANQVLGMLALNDEDINKSEEFLMESAKFSNKVSPNGVIASPQLDSFGPSMVLAKALLEKGQSKPVLYYLDLCKSFWKLENGKISEWEKQINKGIIPDFGANLKY